MIIHFTHDPGPKMVFSSLDKFLAAMHSAGTNGCDIDDIAGEPICIPLEQTITELAKENSDDATFLLTLYLPVTAGLQKETKDSLASHKDFFVREAFATFLAGNPEAADLAIAERLASDRHSQVARVGKIALTAIRRGGRRG